ncbi:MAG: FGGY-family carbohydrate kinase, partial [Sphingobacterium sp.]
MGGVAKKAPFIMQMMADVMNMPIKIHRSEQTCAIGAAMFAATVAGVYPHVEEAMEAMGQGFDAEYFPNSEKANIYQKRYQKYSEAGAFIERKISQDIDILSTSI